MAGFGVVVFGFLGLFAFADAYKCRSARGFDMALGFVFWGIALYLQSTIG